MAKCCNDLKVSFAPVVSFDGDLSCLYALYTFCHNYKGASKNPLDWLLHGRFIGSFRAPT
jgi:hypothetical protein